MSYLALYRKYRPTTFEDVIDQNHITQTLINQIKNDKVGHAYLFCGSRGTGKTSTAKIFAKAINCTDSRDGSPCHKCTVCQSMTENNMDILEIDAASNNGVDEVRDLREKIKYPPVVGKYKVYIIDEVHMLSTSAFNALLKTLEEPPSHAVFILATTEVHKLPATILSRCMRFDFKLVSTDAIAKLLEKIFKQDSIKYDPKAVSVIARAGEGSVRDALSIADMVVSFSDSNITLDSVMEVVGSIDREKLSSIVQSMLAGDTGNVLLKLDKVLGEGKSPLVLSKELISHLRDLLVIMTIPEQARTMVLVPNDVYRVMETQASADNYPTIVRAIEKLSEIEQELRYSVHPKIVLETGMLRAMHLDDLEKRIKNLENLVQNPENITAQKKTNKVVNTILTESSSPEAIVPVSSEEQQSKSSEQEIEKSFVPTNNLDESIKDVTDEAEIKLNDDENRDLIFGELLRFLRKNSHMILYSICSEFEDVRLDNDKIIFSITDEGTLELLNAQSNKSVLEGFFKERGMEFIFEHTTREEIEEELRQKLGNKLKVSE